MSRLPTAHLISSRLFSELLFSTFRSCLSFVPRPHFGFWYIHIHCARCFFSPFLLLLQEIVNGAAIQAKIPTALVRKQKGGKIDCTSETMDCVVSVYGFSGGVAAGSGKDGGGGAPATLKGLASEVARVLKPGGTVLFVEKGEAKELVRGATCYFADRKSYYFPCCAPFSFYFCKGSPAFLWVVYFRSK